MDWFQRLTGFAETRYDETRQQLVVEGERLRSLANGGSWGIGRLELVSLADLRARAAAAGGLPGRLRVAVQQADVRQLHQAPELAGALFQVASQFNLLEMDHPQVTPEQGVGRYEHDHTQGPACAMAAGAATIYRNYFVPVGDQRGQTAARQLDGLADLGAALAAALGRPQSQLWAWRNGYALCSEAGLTAIAGNLAARSADEIDHLRGLLRIGWHQDVEVTLPGTPPGQRVSQAFCSALPVSYTPVPAASWQPFATLVLRAAYEATLWAAVLNARRGASPVVLLTLLGGGAFGNPAPWIHGAIRHALQRLQACALDVRLVSYGTPAAALLQLAQEFDGRG